MLAAVAVVLTLVVSRRVVLEVAVRVLLTAAQHRLQVQPIPAAAAAAGLIQVLTKALRAVQVLSFFPYQLAVIQAQRRVHQR